MHGSAFASTRDNAGVGPDFRVSGGRSGRAARGHRRPGRRVFRPTGAAGAARTGAVSRFSIALHARAGVRPRDPVWPGRRAIPAGSAGAGPGGPRGPGAAAVRLGSTAGAATALGGPAWRVHADRPGRCAGALGTASRLAE